jgi:hypothetical protein
MRQRGLPETVTSATLQLHAGVRTGRRSSDREGDSAEEPGLTTIVEAAPTAVWRPFKLERAMILALLLLPGVSGAVEPYPTVAVRWCSEAEY